MLARHRVAITIVALCLLVSAARLAHANGFTLEQVMSSPFPSDLIASKQGDKLASVFDHLGRRNIWIAEAPQFAGRQLSHYTADDGQEITEPVFSPVQHILAWLRRIRAQMGRHRWHPSEGAPPGVCACQ